MKLITRRERIFGRGSSRYIYRSILNGMSIATADTKEAAEQDAYKRLYDAFDSIGSSCAVRVAQDGTIIVVRLLSKTEAMVEHCRGGRSSGCSFGQMTMGHGGQNGMAKSVHEYADYILAQYDHVESPELSAR